MPVERAVHPSKAPFPRRSLIFGGIALGIAPLVGCVRRGSGEEPPNEPAPTPGTTLHGGDMRSPLATARTGGEVSANPAAVSSRASTASSPAAAQAPVKTIYLLPLGAALADADVAYVESVLRLFFPFPIRRLPAAELPVQAYYAPRRRYRAERLLEYLERHTPEDAQVMMGLTEVDISTTKGGVYDWGILGLATLSGQHCVISRFRAQRGAKDATHIKQRLAKTVVHEVGHTIGLPHCPHYGCLMEDGKGSVLTTDHERDVCAECRAKVGSLMLPGPAAPPW